MELAIVLTAQVLTCDFQRCRTGVNTMQLPHSWCHKPRPSPTSAAEIESCRSCWQLCPGEKREVLPQHGLKFARRDSSLVKFAPFLAEPFHNSAIQIVHGFTLSWASPESTE